jgi:uncharacterized protein YhaN
MRRSLSVVVVAVFLVGFQPGASVRMSAAALPSQPHVRAGEIDVSSSTSIELFRQHTEKQRHEAQEPQHKSQAQERSLVAEMSRTEYEVRQLFDRASTAERDNIIRFIEVLIRNLKRQSPW